MASSVKVVMKPHQIHPGKERQVEHARQLVQQGLNRGMRLQEAPKIVPLPPDEVGDEVEGKEPVQEPEPKPAPKVQKKKSVKNEVVTEVQDSPLTASPVPMYGYGSQYKAVGGNKIVTVVGGAWDRGFVGQSGFILLADTNLLKKGNTQVTAIDYEIFKKKFEKA